MPGLPFRRIALVLSGGGAYGAYEVGVLKVLERIGLVPSIVTGVSVGAINAVVWAAHGGTTAVLERTWRELRGEAIGMRWSSLLLRAGGVLVAVFASLEVVLTLAGPWSTGVGGALFVGGHREIVGAWSTLAEIVAWLVLAIAAVVVTRLAPRIEDRVGAWRPSGSAEGLRPWLMHALLLAFGVYFIVVVLGIPWPRRLHALLMIMGACVWLASGQGPVSLEARSLLLRMLPETRGRGLWRGHGRLHLLNRLVAEGDPSRLVAGPVHLIMSACSVATGRMSYFVNWAHPEAGFRSRIEALAGDVVSVTRPQDVIEAAVASSAVPMLFEPWRFRGADYLDGGVFSNQPLHAALADGADALLVVLVAPSTEVDASVPDANLIELGARLRHIANWRDLQTELREIPKEWSDGDGPPRQVVIEPAENLPGRMFELDPALASEMIDRGEADAWRALERAGWIETRA